MTQTLDRPAGAGVRRPVAFGVAGKAAELGTLVLLAVAVPRSFGPSSYGVFAVALTIVSIGSVAMTLGGPTLLARYVPAAAPAERVALARALSLRLAWGRAAQLAVLALAGAALAAGDAERFPPSLTALVLGALACSVATTLVLQVGLGLGRTVAWSVRYPLQNAVLVGAALALHSRWGVTGAVAALPLSAAAAFAVAVLVAWPELRAHTTRVCLPPGAVRFGLLAATGGALSQLAHRGGILAVALLAGSAAQTGHAALALGLALAATYAVVQLFTVVLPKLAESDLEGAAAGEAVLRRMAGALLAVLLPATIAVALALESLVPLVFGSAYASAASAFGPALALVVLAPVNAVALQVAALRLRPGVTLASALAAVLTVAGVSVAAVPTWGAPGATAATAAGAAVSAAVAMAALPGVGRLLGAASLAGAGLVALVAALA